MADTLARLLTLDDVAERLAVSRRTAERLVASGQLRIVRFGGNVRVTERELAAFVAARERRGRIA